MRRIAVLAAMVAMLGACQQPEAPPATAPADAGTPETLPSPDPRPAPAAQKGMDQLADWGISVPFDYFVAYDIIDHNRTGTPRHRVLLEVTGGSMADAAGAMERALADVGYAKASETDVDGKLDQVFRKSGAPTLVLRSQPVETGPKLKQPGAVGSIHVMWNKS